jgi:hypothetical protein
MTEHAAPFLVLHRQLTVEVSYFCYLVHLNIGILSHETRAAHKMMAALQNLLEDLAFLHA